MQSKIRRFAWIAFLAVLPLGADVFGFDYHQDPRYLSVATAHVIRIQGEGVMDVAYSTAQDLFEREDILDTVQQAYAALLPKDQKPEFEIVSGGDHTWSYVNRQGQYSRVDELHRDIKADAGSMLVYYTEGERFFGNFRAIIEIMVEPLDEGSIRYHLQVLAYPESSISRFFARHFGLAERFFRAKTKEVTAITVNICRYLNQNQPALSASLPHDS